MVYDNVEIEYPTIKPKSLLQKIFWKRYKKKRERAFHKFALAIINNHIGIVTEQIAKLYFKKRESIFTGLNFPRLK